MLRVAFRSLLAHKLRLGMTALAVVLGVSFVSGTYVLSDTLNATFDQLFQGVYQGVDVTIRGAQEFEVGEGPDQMSDARPRLPETLLDDIRAVEGVADAQGHIDDIAAFVDKDGEAIIPNGPPTIAVTWSDNTNINPLTLRSGEAPDGPGEVAMDAGTAEANSFVVGDRVDVVTRGPRRGFTISGIVGIGELDNLAGATLAVFDLETAQELFDKQGQLDTIDVTSEPGVSPATLRERISEEIGTDYDVATGSEITQENSEALKDGLSFFSTALLAFAAIALFVGSFIIANTFSIIVAQRTKELALLRAVGALRRQVMGSIVVEALLTGAIASAAGVGVGILVALGLRSVLNGFGLELPSGPLEIGPKALFIPPIIGVGVTVLSSLAPARRATKVPPVAAMRDDFVIPSGSSRRLTFGGAGVVALGVSVLALGLFGGISDPLPLVGLGAVSVFLGVALILPVFAGPVAGWIGRPFARWFRVPGRLARDNSMRNPKRTAATASALMIGMALVGLVTVFASSITASTTDLIEGSTNFDLIVQAESFSGFSPEVAASIRELPEAGTVVGFRSGQARIGGEGAGISGTDLSQAGEVLIFEMVEGSVDSAAGGGILVSEQVAEERSLHRGDELTLRFQSTPSRRLTVEGIYERNPLAGNYVVGLPVFEEAFVTQQDFVVLIKATDSASIPELRSAVDATISGFPNVKAENKDEYLASQEDQINQLLGLISALLGLALIIAFIGIVNTLALSIFERTREIGMLRAIGMARRQVKRMVRWESVIVSLLGALLGLVIGIGFGWAFVSALGDEGLNVLAIPLGTLLVYALIAGLAGTVAAVLPARRAARIDLLRAITTE